MVPALLIAAFVLVFGPFIFAIFFSELRKVKQNRHEAERAHKRIDRLVEDKLSPEEQRSLRQRQREQDKQDENNRDFFEYGGC